MSTPLKPNLTDAMGKLHRASCIHGYISESALNNDDVLIDETTKAAEHLVLNAMNEIREVQG